MASIFGPEPIRIGLIADEPVRLEGLRTIFDQPASAGKGQLIPIVGVLEELLADVELNFIVVDLNSSTTNLEALGEIRRRRPAMRQVVIGTEGTDETVLESIIAGARAYLDATADPATVRMAIEVVTEGSIWAPRRLLSKLIDRLLNAPDSSLTNGRAHLTSREQQVLELLLLARSNREIARDLGIEERTVKAHVGRLMRKTGAENRIELSMRALNRPLDGMIGVADRRKGDRRQGERRQGDRRVE